MVCSKNNIVILHNYYCIKYFLKYQFRQYCYFNIAILYVVFIGVRHGRVVRTAGDIRAPAFLPLVLPITAARRQDSLAIVRRAAEPTPKSDLAAEHQHQVYVADIRSALALSAANRSTAWRDRQKRDMENYL